MATTATVNGQNLPDGRVNDRIENYTKFWQKDMGKEANVDTENRIDSYTDVVNGELDSFQERKVF